MTTLYSLLPDNLNSPGIMIKGAKVKPRPEAGWVTTVWPRPVKRAWVPEGWWCDFAGVYPPGGGGRGRWGEREAKGGWRDPPPLPPIYQNGGRGNLATKLF